MKDKKYTQNECRAAVSKAYDLEIELKALKKLIQNTLKINYKEAVTRRKANDISNMHGIPVMLEWVAYFESVGQIHLIKELDAVLQKPEPIGDVETQ